MRFPELSSRRDWSATGITLAVAVAAASVAVVVAGLLPKPAPVEGSGRALGTVSLPDASGKRTYESGDIRFRFRYPADWRLTESVDVRAPEGHYLTISLRPKTARGSGTVDPPQLQVVPDPQGFSAEAIVRSRWDSEPATLPVTTSTVDVAGERAVEVVESRPDPPHKTVYTYDLVMRRDGPMFDLRFSSSNTREFAAMREQLRRIAATIETY